ncbi:hypothetical protein PR001_g12101 [Phytophthora rubi]|uniref:CCHC-type domain-containing protein n=1 Tax=Phytophthora rubi TaxID=129364 RepID=A0A6A3MB91_9STRA|nr:hypothetical protein PR001_g12101 [Phytophthora rubi]
MAEPSPPKRSRANTDGDAGNNSVRPKGVTLQEPPLIRSFAHEALVKWKHERVLYEDAVENRCAETGEAVTAVRRPVLKSINKRLLKSEFELRIPVENITEEMLTAAIDHILGSVMNDATPDVMGIMAQHLKMDLGQKDVKARILDYFDCMDEVIEVHGMGKILKSNAKLKCKIIVENLRPGTLKDQVKRAIEYDPALKADLHRLFDVVKHEAIKNQQTFDLYQRMDKRDNGNKDSRHKKQVGHDKKQFNYDKKQVINDKKQGHHDDRRPAHRQAHRKREGPPPNGCLHCRRSDHWLGDCPTADETQKREALRAYLEKKKGGSEKTTVKRLATSGCIGDREVIFNDLVVMPYCLDNGTTYNIIPRNIVQELQILDPTVEPLKLDTPVEGVAVGGALITCTEFEDLDIGLQTVAGRVNLRGLTCIITETPEEEFLLGKRTLKALGIDVDELLAGLVTRGVADIDPFDDERDYKPIAGPDADAIKARLSEMVAEAVNNGFPTERSEELYAIASKRDIWRLQISDDPPARLPPFTIRLKDGAEPYRCKPRQYAPAQRDFLRQLNEKLIDIGWA